MIMTRIVLFSKKIVQSSVKLASEKPKNQGNISGEKNLTWSYKYLIIVQTACQWVSHNALFWKSQTHSVNDTIYNFNWVLLEIPVKNCIVGMLLTCRIPHRRVKKILSNFMRQGLCNNNVIFHLIFQIYSAKSYLLSLTECVWEFQWNTALWDTHWHALLEDSSSVFIVITTSSSSVLRSPRTRRGR